MISITMPKECAAIVITNMVEQRSLGTALMINFMQLVCARIAI